MTASAGIVSTIGHVKHTPRNHGLDRSAPATLRCSSGTRGHELGARGLDTLASTFGTLPRFIRYNATDNTVDILSEWTERDARDENIDFDAFYTEASQVFPDVERDEMLRVWLVAHKDILADSNLAYFVQLQTGVDVADFLRHDAAEFETVIARQIIQLHKSIEKRAEAAEALSEGLEHTEFFPKSKTYRMVVTQSDTPLAVVFDNTVPSDLIPFASFAHMYKYVPTFTPKPGMEVSSDAAVILRRANDETVLVITSTADLVVEFTVTQDESLTGVVDSIVDVLLRNEDLSGQTHIAQTGVQGFYYFLGHAIDQYIFADFIMNTDIVVPLVSLGEFVRPSRSNIARIYGHSPKVSATISTRTAGGQSSDTRYISELISPGDQYLRVFVARAVSDTDATAFIETLARVLAMYVKTYPKIYAIYKSYIPSFPSAINLSRKFTAPTSSERDPQIFVANYSRLCPHIPDAVQPGEHPKISIEFPIGSGQMYTCNDPVYKYPGVRKNTLANVAEFPFIPCCFKTDQTSKPKFVKYYGAETSGKTGQQIRMITTDKPLNPEFFGVLPPSINDLLISLDPTRSYVRYGVGTDASTFNTCLQVAIDQNINRASLISRGVDIVVAAQENPGQTLVEMRAAITDPAKYLSPRRFVRLLEEVYAANIYIFDKNGIVVPDHVCAYYRYVRDHTRPTIIVYEHPDVSRCELVSGWDPATGEYTHVHPSELGKQLDVVTNELESVWVGRRKLGPITKPPFFAKCTGQYVDMYGKMRGVVSDNAYMDLSPLPPLNLPLVDKQYFQSANTEQFAKKYAKYVGHWVDGVYTSLPIANPSTIETAMTNYRMAQYLSEVSLFKYSQWVENTGLSDLAQFMRDVVDIDPGFVYVLNGPSTADLSGVEQMGKLVLLSHRMAERLLFVLRRALERTPARVADYRSKKYFDNFYTSIDSFKKGPFVLSTSVSEIVLPSEVVALEAPFLEEGKYVITLGDTVYTAMPISADSVRGESIDSAEKIPSDANVIVYNGPQDITRIEGGGSSTVMVYKTSGVKKYAVLTRV